MKPGDIEKVNLAAQKLSLTVRTSVELYSPSWPFLKALGEHAFAPLTGDWQGRAAVFEGQRGEHSYEVYEGRDASNALVSVEVRLGP